MKKNLIIAFLLGLLISDYTQAMKVPGIQIPDTVEPELSELVQNYIIPILNNGKYVCRVSATAILTDDELNEGEFLMDVSGVSKYFVISDGTTNYRAQVTAF